MSLLRRRGVNAANATVVVPVGGPTIEATETTEMGSSTGTAVSLPAGVVDGDLLLMVLLDINPRLEEEPIVGGGWRFEGRAQIASDDTSPAGVTILSRIAASEPASYTTDYSQTSRAFVHVLRITGHDPDLPVIGASAGDGLTMPSLSPAVADARLIAGLSTRDSTAIGQPAGMTLQSSDLTTGSERSALATEGGLSAATGVRTWTGGTSPSYGEVLVTPTLTAPPGAGTSGDPYVLTTSAHLHYLRAKPSAHFSLDADVSLPPGLWVPVDFSGVLEGHGYVIDGTDATAAGRNGSLFGSLSGTVRKLGVEHLDVSALVDTYLVYKSTLFATLNGGTVEDCYVEGGTVSTDGDRAGGMGGITESGTWTRCWSAQARTGAVDSRVGGIGGFNNGGTLTSLLFDSDVWADTSTGGNGGIGVAQTTVQMQQEATFTGFDFTNVWQITEGSDYPRLRKGI